MDQISISELLKFGSHGWGNPYWPQTLTALNGLFRHVLNNHSVQSNSSWHTQVILMIDADKSVKLKQPISLDACNLIALQNVKFAHM